MLKGGGSFPEAGDEEDCRRHFGGCLPLSLRWYR